MFKKIFIAGLAVTGGLFILNSTHLGAYARTAWHKVRTSAQRQVPLEFQLESIRHEAAQLIPDMKKHCGTIAAEMVAVQTLRDEVADIRSNLDKRKAQVRIMRDDLKSGAVKISYGGHTYSADRVRDKLSRDLASCKRCSEELTAKEQLLEAKEKALDTAREQLASMRSQKEQLEVQIAQIEADLKTLRLAQTRSNFQIDDSRLSRIKGALADIRKQMKVQEKEAELYATYSADPIPVEQKVKTPAQLDKEVEEFLSESSKPESTVVEKP
jgi:DNA repair exonuclease SbcCD ATPase subunit